MMTYYNQSRYFELLQYAQNLKKHGTYLHFNKKHKVD